MTGGRGRSWRGGAAPRREADEKPTRSWRRTRGRSRSTHPQEPSSRRRKFRIFLSLLLLAVFVTAGIALWRLNPLVHTHFVSIDLLGRTPLFARSTPATLPEAKSERFSVSRISRSRPAGLKFTADDSADAGSPSASGADVTVIYANLLTVPGPQGAHWCLVDNGTPDLRSGPDYQKLSDLKDSLTQLPPDQHKLLLLDLETQPDWRLGLVGDDLTSQLQSWQQDIPNLVIVCSSDATTANPKTGSSGRGRTAFGEIVQRAFTQAADAEAVGGNADQHLSLPEFCRYVSSATDDWVRYHRDQAGQAVTLYPPLDEITRSGSDWDFIVMKNLPPAPPAAAGVSVGDSVQQLLALWQQRDALDQRAAVLWQPLRWRAATNALLAAQQNLIDGRNESVQEFQQLAAAQLEVLNSASPAASDVAGQRGLRADWFRDLPTYRQLQSLWNNSAAGDAAAESGPQPAEDVLAASLQSYPFRDVGLTEPGSAATETAIRVRLIAEAATAASYGTAVVLQDLIPEFDARLLQSEDLLFVGTPAQPAPDTEQSDSESAETLQQNAGAFFRAVQDYAVARQQAETTLFYALDNVPAVTSLAAELGQQLMAVERTEFLDSLKPGSQTVPRTQPSTGSRIPAHTVQLLRQTEALVTLLRQVTDPETKLEINDLRQQTQQLQDAERQTSAALQTLQQSLTEAITQCVADGGAGAALPEQVPQLLELRRRAHQLLQLPQTDPSKRRDLLTIVLQIDSTLADQKITDPSAETESAAPASQTSDRLSVWQAAWMLQVHNLLAAVSGDLQRRDELWAAWETLQSATGSDHEQRAVLAQRIRGHWANVRDQRLTAALAASGHLSDRISKLETAAVESRLLTSSYDIDRLLTLSGSPTELVNALRRFRYCLLHADRSLQSHWLAPAEHDRPESQHWYVRQASHWLTAAEQTAQDLQSGSQAGITELLQEQVQQRKQRLQQITALAFDVGLPARQLVLGQADQQRLTESVTVQARHDAELRGLATLRIRSGSPLVAIEQNSQPIPLPLAGQSAERRFTFRGLSTGDVSDCGVVPLPAEIFFRGDLWPVGALQADPCPPDSRTLRLVGTADTGSVVVDGRDIRPIMFVLDWSGSMNRNGVGRHLTLLNTLNKLLSTLTNQDRAGLIVYGHRMNGAGRSNPDYELAFQRPVPPTLVDREDVEVLFEPALLNSANRQKLQDVIEKLRRVPPWGSTPLGLALTRAANGFKSEESGLIIAITDGAATDLGDADRLKALGVINVDDKDLASITAANRRVLQQLKDAFRKESHAAAIVALDLEDNQRQLGQLKQVFQQTQTPQQGELNFPILSAGNDQARLFEEISQALDPREFTVTGTRSGIQRTARLSNPVRDLPPDLYSVSFARMQLTELSIRGGEEFRLQPDWRAGKLVVDRQQPAPFARASQPSGQESGTTDAPTKLRALDQVTLSGEQNQPATATLTVMLDHDDVFRPVVQPAEIDIEVQAAGLESYRADRITRTFTYAGGAPGWTLELIPWPEIPVTREVNVNARWKMQRTVPDDFLPLSRVLQADGREQALEFGGTGNRLPEMLVWSRQQDGGRLLQIGLALKPGTGSATEHHGIRVEIGVLDALDRPEEFQPLNWTKTITYVENGPVENAFLVQQPLESLGTLSVAFTSQESLQQDSYTLVAPLNPGRPRR